MAICNPISRVRSVNPYELTPRLTGYVNSIYVQAATPELVATAIQQVTGKTRPTSLLVIATKAIFSFADFSRLSLSSSRFSLRGLCGGGGVLNFRRNTLSSRAHVLIIDHGAAGVGGQTLFLIRHGMPLPDDGNVGDNSVLR
jgi:hypothetical protein